MFADGLEVAEVFVGNQNSFHKLFSRPGETNSPDRRIEGGLESTTLRAASNIGADDDCC